MMTRTEQTKATEFKTELARRLRSAMIRRRMTQSELARRMRTSRAVIYRLLQADDVSVTLSTIAKAATALEVVVSIRLKEAIPC